MSGYKIKNSKFWPVLKPFLGIAAAVFINIFFNRLMGLLHIPLFMDNIGTLLAAGLGGYLPGIITGYMTNVVNMTADIENVYYASLSVLIAVAGSFFYKHGYFDKFGKALITVPAFAAIGGALGSFLTYCIYGFGMGEGISAPFASKLLEKGVFNVFTAQFVSDVAIDLVDKFLTVLAVFLILKVIPSRIKDSMGLYAWRQNPISKDDRARIKKDTVKGIPLGVKITMVVALFMIIIAFVTTSISCILYHSFAMEQLSTPGITLESIRLSEVSFLAKVLSLFVGFFLMILALSVWLARYFVIYPINAMTLVAERFAYDTEKDRAKSVDSVKNLDIRTRDEIENLYSAMSLMMEESVEHMEYIKKKGEEISKMQNGLINVLADVVESRDQKTGHHIKKTAAYTRYILKSMKEDGLHADIITPKYIENVANSAPLHDLGKIVVSDMILNKNGRLDDAEFEKMKSHTLAGRDIIKKTMELAPDPGYLEEAEKLATYHHEKWDGSGYPMGIQGGEIPLSARVMAIADVLDALLSKRSYKEPYSFEEAVRIIQEGSGKHFDPEIVNVFMHHIDGIKEIADSLDKDL